MPATTSQAPRAQPWKAHWSPANDASEKAGQKYMVDDAGALLIDGYHHCASTDLFPELGRSHNDAGALKVQPWKAHWSPANDSSERAGQKYMVDDAGALLIDGYHHCATVDLFAELSSSQKVEKE